MGSFRSEELDKVLKVSCPLNLDATAARDFAEQSKNWLQSTMRHYVIDLNGVIHISRDFYQALIQLKTALKRDQKSIYSINLSAEINKQIKIDGVEQAFNPIKSLEVLSDKSVTSGNSFNVALINPFLAGAQKTLEVQCMTTASPGKPYLKTKDMPDVAIAGVLTLISNEFTGSIVLCFSQKVFLKIYENMFGEKHDQITAEIEDAAGELLNIIYGMAKMELNPTGFNFQKAFPTVLTGEKMRIRQNSAKPAVVIPFETAAGPFHIEIEFNKASETNHV